MWFCFALLIDQLLIVPTMLLKSKSDHEDFELHFNGSGYEILAAGFIEWSTERMKIAANMLHCHRNTHSCEQSGWIPV